MAQQQQTVLRVQSRKTEFVLPSGSLIVRTGTTLNLSGSGTTLNPYTGTTTGLTATAIFEVVGNVGTIQFGIEGENFFPNMTGWTSSSISFVRNGIGYLVRETTKTMPVIQDSFNVQVGDIITVIITSAGCKLNYLYFEEDVSNRFTYQYDILDTYTDIPIKINKSFAELQDISKRNSDYSIGLTLPGSKKNNSFFEDFFNVDISLLYFNPNKRVPAQVLINDELYFDGYLKLNKVNVLNTKTEYDVTLYSNIGDLFGKIGNNLLKDLDFSNPIFGFNHNFGAPEIINSWDIKGFTNQNPKSYFYPIVHNGYEYSGDTVNLNTPVSGSFAGVTRLYTTSRPINSYQSQSDFTNAPNNGKIYRLNTSGTGILDNQLKPALSIYQIFQLIFQTYGYKIKSQFFNTPWMKGLYMYGYFNNDTTKFSWKSNPPIIPPTQSVKFEKTSQVILGPNPCPYNLQSTLTFKVINTQTGVEEVAEDFYSLSLDFYLYPPGSSTPTPYNIGVTIPRGSTGTTYTWFEHREFYINLTCQRQWRIFRGINLNNSTIYDRQQKLVPQNIFIQDGDYVDFSKIIDVNLKQIDILSSIAKKFNLVFVPNPENTSEIIIEPYQYYIGTGEIKDWTDRISFDKGFSIEPALNYIESELILTDLEDGDDGNKQFKDKNNRIYGQNYVFNQTDFKSTQKKIETIFSPQITRKWDENVAIPLGINYSASNSSEASGDSEKVKWSYKGVKTKPKLFYYLGNFSPFFSVVGAVYNANYNYNTYKFYIESSDDVLSFTVNDAPVISNTMPIGNPDFNKINNDSICILFNSEQPTDIGVETFSNMSAYTDKDAYNLFYENRVNNLYNANTRFLSGYLDLKLSDIKNLSPRDLIKINEKYFTWNKIENYNLTNPELTKVELIQIDNNPSVYPTRYFQYYYCANPTLLYNIKTDFTNDNLIETHFYLSNIYDYNVGLLDGTVSGYTTSFIKAPYTYLPYNIYEIDKDTYNSTGFDYTSDPNFNWDDNVQINNQIQNFWLSTTNTGLNLWNDCASFSRTKNNYGLIEYPPVTGTPITTYTTGITLNILVPGWLKYTTRTGEVYRNVTSVGPYVIPDCADCTTIRPGIPNQNLAVWNVITCGNTC